MLPSGARVGFYDDRLRRRFLREKELEDRFPHALANGEFHMYLQPKVALPERRIVGARRSCAGSLRKVCSARTSSFRSSSATALSPSWISTCLPGVRFVEAMGAGGEAAFLRFRQRLALELRRFGFLRALRAPYRREQVPARYLEFEFTESVVFDRTGEINQVIRRIHALGARCSMDDFGSSYSSLNMLRSLEVDIIKLDQGSSAEIPTWTRQGASSTASWHSARHAYRNGCRRDRGYGQVDFLESVGCNVVQGYVFGKPMPADEFQDFKLDDTMRRNGDRR